MCYNFSFISSKNIWWLLAIQNGTFWVKTAATTLRQLLENIGLLFTPSPGNTRNDRCLNMVTVRWSLVRVPLKFYWKGNLKIRNPGNPKPKRNAPVSKVCNASYLSGFDTNEKPKIHEKDIVYDLLYYYNELWVTHIFVGTHLLALISNPWSQFMSDFCCVNWRTEIIFFAGLVLVAAVGVSALPGSRSKVTKFSHFSSEINIYRYYHFCN